MTATHTPGLAVVGEGWLVSTNPATGAEVARVRIAGPGEVAATVARARPATIALEFSARLEDQPLGVVGAIGPWNYPAAAICVLAA